MSTEYTPRDYRVMTKAGKLRNGYERGGGSVWHYVPGQPWDGDPALCGEQPALQWSSRLLNPQDVTCPKCIRRMAALAGAP